MQSASASLRLWGEGYRRDIWREAQGVGAHAVPLVCNRKRTAMTARTCKNSTPATAAVAALDSRCHKSSALCHHKNTNNGKGDKKNTFQRGPGMVLPPSSGPTSNLCRGCLARPRIAKCRQQDAQRNADKSRKSKMLLACSCF